MASSKRVLLVSASMVLLCLCIMVGATYALFTDSATIHNHLTAGELNIKLERTALEYTVLDSEGRNVVITKTGSDDFSDTTLEEANIFGLLDDRLIAPGNYAKATLVVSNEGTVAFDYVVYVNLESQLNDLADQLQVMVFDENDQQVGETMFLKDIGMATNNDLGYPVFSGESIGASDSDTFTIQITFYDDTNSDYDRENPNNDAENLQVMFDLIIDAVQNTTPLETQ